MLGRDHALLGGAAYLAGVPAFDAARHLPLMPAGQLAVGTVVCAGFALFPDIDEPGSTISRKLGPISRTVSHLTNRLAGGHRHATHSLFFVAAVWLAADFALRSKWAIAAIVFCAFALSLRFILPFKLGRSLGLAATVAPLIAAYWAAHSGTVGSWLPWTCALGVFLHLIGDAVTVEGVPFLWVPFVKRLQRIYIKAAILGHTQSLRESIVGSMLGVVILFFAFHDFSGALAAHTITAGR